MTKRRRDYLSYLLRMWRSGEDQDAVWRALLESPMTEERWGFASLKDLFAFLETQAEGQGSQEHQTDGSEEQGDDGNVSAFSP